MLENILVFYHGKIHEMKNKIMFFVQEKIYYMETISIPLLSPLFVYM